MNTHLILGGASSGKTRHAQHSAEATALQHNQSLFYIATARLWDDEMRAKAQAHQQERKQATQPWHTLEVALDITACLSTMSAENVVLIDSLGLWVSNVLLDDANLETLRADLVDALHQCPATVFIVGDEVGQGIIPDNALARRFRVANGETNQHIAAIAQRVDWVVAGLVWQLK